MILTIGTTPALARSMIFPRIELNGVNRASEVRVAAAGKSINVARVIHTLGEPVTAATLLGGETGRQVTSELTAAGVKLEFVETAAPTRVCVTAIDQTCGQCTELIEPCGAIGDLESDQFWSLLCQRMPEASLSVLAGTLAPGIPPGLGAMVSRLATHAQIPLIVDMLGEPLLLALPEHPWMVKMNRNELELTLGSPLSSDGELRRGMLDLIQRGARRAAITLGPSGAILTDGRTFWQAVAPKVPVVSPIGSGDAFAAGLAVAYRRGLEDAEALRLAISCGAANAMTAQAGFLDPNVVRDLSGTVEVVTD
ncbi:MAG: hexose kinase [Phycisphaerae bacterium]|nr:hexose kinase [Phycisphaerae bacterium]